MKEVEAAYARPQADWARQRLLAVRLIAQHEATIELIAKVADVCRKMVFNYRARCCEISVAPGAPLTGS